jgi:hypothetical protein
MTGEDAAATPPRRTARLPVPLRIANAFVLLWLLAAVALRPASAPVLGALALPLALSLWAGRAGAGTAARGWAFGTGSFCLLGCAAMLLFAGLGHARGQYDLAQLARGVAVFAPVLALCVANVRRLVGPD